MEIFQPYRIIPIGSHCDHQNGIITGIIINKGITVKFDSKNQNGLNGIFKIMSDVEGKINYDPINSIPKNLIEWTCWYMYINFNVNGFKCNIISDYKSGGLASSSALVKVLIETFDYIYKLNLTKDKMVKLILEIEKLNGQKYGMVDPYILVYGEKQNLFVIDCSTFKFENIKIKFKYSIEIIKLKNSPILYNDKVKEMFDFANLFNKKSLRYVSKEILSSSNKGVVKYFFNEQNRIPLIIKSVKENNKNLFLELIKQSGYSSLYDYGIGDIDEYNENLSCKFGRRCCTKNNMFIIN